VRSGLSGWTAGLAGERDPAQPVLTLLDGPARVELSGATAANWVAKSAWLLTDGLALAPGARVGLLLPLHWQSVCLLLAGVTAGATVVTTADPAGLDGCDVAFTTAEHAAAAVAAGPDDVLALSCTPFGTPLPPAAGLPRLVLDYAREVPSYGDVWTGPTARHWSVETWSAAAGGTPLVLPELGLTPADRLLVSGSLADPVLLGALLAALHAGAAVVLVPDPATVDLPAAAAAEQVTASAGLAVAQVRALS
jgi:uncharacterized protein (TIGR03089 family)